MKKNGKKRGEEKLLKVIILNFNLKSTLVFATDAAASAGSAAAGIV